MWLCGLALVCSELWHSTCGSHVAPWRQVCPASICFHIYKSSSSLIITIIFFIFIFIMIISSSIVGQQHDHVFDLSASIKATCNLKLWHTHTQSLWIFTMLLTFAHHVLSKVSRERIQTKHQGNSKNFWNPRLHVKSTAKLESPRAEGPEFIWLKQGGMSRVAETSTLARWMVSDLNTPDIFFLIAA